MRVSLRNLFCLITLIVVPAVDASPWISVGDNRLKQHLHLLSNTGVIGVQLTTWPIMWSDVNVALSTIDDDTKLTKAQRLAIQELKFEMRYQTNQEMKRSLELAASSSSGLFRDFSGQELEKGRITHRFDWDSIALSVRLQANLTTDPGEDAVQSQLYGSYIAGVLGNWVLGVGAIDRWWGGGNQSSLILGNNAQPVPSVFLQTKGTQYFETPWLSWLGGWQFTSFVGQLESNRHISEAKLTGMRFSFSPFDDLEIGLSRAMQWGGEGRSESLSTFWKSLTSQGENTSQQSGNQLAGYDIRYQLFRQSMMGSSLYAQLIGEDEAGYLPSKFLSLLGVEASFSFNQGESLKVFAEHANTIAGSIGGKQFDTAYDHSVYRSGFRYRGRSLGAAYDNDSKAYTLGARYQLNEAAQALSGAVSFLDLNVDDSSGGNTVSHIATELYSLDLAYERLVLNGLMTLRGQYLPDIPTLLKNDVDKFSLSMSWHYRF